MKKTSKKTDLDDKTASKSAEKGTFEERLTRLEELGEDIRRNDIPLEEAVKAFEEGIVLARGLEKELSRIEGRIEKLLNDADAEPEKEKPELDLFSQDE